jgi:hypothetical protein
MKRDPYPLTLSRRPFSMYPKEKKERNKKELVP